MSRILYAMERCPSCKTVLVLIKALGLDIPMELVETTNKDHLKEDFLKMNPAHTIPVLKDGDFILWDSHAIVTYLVTKYAETEEHKRLYPEDIEKRAIVDQMLHFDSNTLYQKTSGYFVPQIMEGLLLKEREPDFLEKFQVFEKILSKRPFAAGEHLTVADISLMSTVHMAIACQYDFEKTFPVVWEWIQRVKAELPFYDEFTRKGQEHVTNLYLAKRKH